MDLRAWDEQLEREEAIRWALDGIENEWLPRHRRTNFWSWLFCVDVWKTSEQPLMSDATESLLIKVIIALATAWATKNGVTVDGDSLQMLAAGLVGTAAGAYGIYRHWGMKKVPINSVAIATAAPPLPTAVGATTQITGKIVGALFLALAINLAALGNQAHAQGNKSADPFATLIAWNQAALDDANANNDKIAAACYSAIIDVAKAKQAAAPVAINPVLAFQKVRDLTHLNSSPIGTQLIVGCAPLAQDTKLNMVQFFANIGGTILIKGILLP